MGKIMDLSRFGRLDGGGPLGRRGILPEHFFQRNRLEALERMLQAIIRYLTLPDESEGVDDLSVLFSGGRGLLVLLLRLLTGQMLFPAFTGFFAQ